MDPSVSLLTGSALASTHCCPLDGFRDADVFSVEKQEGGGGVCKFSTVPYRRYIRRRGSPPMTGLPLNHSQFTIFLFRFSCSLLESILSFDRT